MPRANPSSLKRKKNTNLVESEVSSGSDSDTFRASLFLGIITLVLRLKSIY